MAKGAGPGVGFLALPLTNYVTLGYSAAPSLCSVEVTMVHGS